jgi:pentapeptide repeat protein
VPWRTVLAWSGLLIAAAVVVAAVLYAVFWPVSDLVARHDVGTIAGPQRAAALQAARDAARARLLTFGAAVFAAGALVYTAHNTTLARRAVELAHRAIETTEQGKVLDRYTEAVEQLGSDKLDVRIGGIYALEREAQDPSWGHSSVMEVLAAFIRVHSHDQWPAATADGKTQRRVTRPDVQAAVIVVGRRIRGPGYQWVSLAKADLGGAELYGIDLAGDALIAVNLTKAKLPNADFTGADLTDADLTHADLTHANLTGADLSSANLTSADLTDANLTGANLTIAELSSANLTHANLTHADLTSADLTDADLTHADLTSADFTDADLTDAKWPLDAEVPQGWQRDGDSGQLKQAHINSGGAATG